MAEKSKVILDPAFRRMDELFSEADRARLYDAAEIVWGKDEPMPVDAFRAAVPDALVVICTQWRYGEDALRSANCLRAIIEVGGAFPASIDYEYCFRNKIRVLSVAPAFGRPVAEMALGMA